MRFPAFSAAFVAVVCLAANPARAQASAVLVKDINERLVTYGVRPEPPYGEPVSVDVGGTAFFRGCAYDGTTGCELWKGDGTAAGTVLVKDILPGVQSSSPSHLTALGGTLFFQACSWPVMTYPFQTPEDCELWTSDGTAVGTVRVKDIATGRASSSPNDMTNFEGTLFFSADDGANGRGLWKSDGTASGTVLVARSTAGALRVTWETGTLTGTAPFAPGTASGTFALDAGEAEVPGIDYGPPVGGTLPARRPLPRRVLT